MLRYYSRRFSTVELNNTFYRFPGVEQVEQWRKATPRGFRFSVKAHRIITHQRRLKGVEELVRVQLERVAGLKDRRGPILFQLPPSLGLDLPLLTEFLYTLPPLPRAVEFRHPSWQTDGVYSTLAEHRAALAIMESDEDEPVLRFVGPFAYLRLHRSRYPAAALAAWAERIGTLLEEGKDVYAYFTHEDGAPATEYAASLRDLVPPGQAPSSSRRIRM